MLQTGCKVHEHQACAHACCHPGTVPLERCFAWVEVSALLLDALLGLWGRMLGALAEGNEDAWACADLGSYVGVGGQMVVQVQQLSSQVLEAIAPAALACVERLVVMRVVQGMLTWDCSLQLPAEHAEHEHAAAQQVAVCCWKMAV